MRSVCDTTFCLNNFLGSGNASTEAKVIDHERQSKRKRCTCASSYVHGTSKPLIDQVGAFRNFSLRVSLQSMIHDKFCPLSKTHPRLTVVTAALQNCGTMLAQAIRASITINRGAGGISISHTLDTARMVPSDSRAFQLVDWTSALEEGIIGSIADFDRLLRDSVQELRYLFRNNSASPCDVSEDGKTLLEVRICVMPLSDLFSLINFSTGCGR